MPAANQTDLERRSFEIRSEEPATPEEPRRIVGYAAVFDQVAYGEVIRKGAFQDSLASNRDIKAYWSHASDQVLGRRANGTLILREDDHGLYVEIIPNHNTTWGANALAAVKRGDVTQFSFAFVPIEERIILGADGEPIRELVSVELYEVSPVAEPWYEGTSAEAKRKPDEVKIMSEEKTEEIKQEEQKAEQIIQEQVRGMTENVGVGRVTPPTASAPPEERKIESVHRYGTLRNFRGRDAERSAHDFGMWALAAIGKPKAREYCRVNGIELRTQLEGTNNVGGYLVPNQFIDSLLEMRDQYGVFRRNVLVVPMSSDVATQPKAGTALTAYWTGENTAGTKSTAGFDVVTLTAKKLAVLAAISSELSEDAAINVGDYLAGQIAYAFSVAEDAAGFYGDGTSTYGSQYGVINRIASVGTASIVEAAAGTSTDWTAITMRDLANMFGKLPSYASTPNCKWYCSGAFFGQVLQYLAMAAGGNTASILTDGRLGRSFLGYPVEIVESMPKTATSTQIVCLFGDLSLAAILGERRQTTITFSGDATVNSVSAFENDLIVVKGTERVAIAVHNVGSSSVAGPVIALKTKAPSGGG